MTEWTPRRIEERLRRAIALKARLSSASKFERFPESIGIIGGIGSKASGDDVEKATEALSWLRWLETEDAEIVLARLNGASWKSICWRFGISRPTGDRRWRYALALMAWRLNDNTMSNRIPSLRSLLR